MFDEIQRGLAAREPAFQLFVFNTREDLFEPGAGGYPISMRSLPVTSGSGQISSLVHSSLFRRAYA